MTTADITPGPAWVPEACTLPTAQQPLRVAQFDDLFATAVQHSERLDPHRLRLTLVGPPDIAATVSDLAARESECCSFFSFTIDSEAPGQVVFDIEVRGAHVDLLGAIHDRVNRLRGTG